MEWRPIETAPKDGTPILVRSADGEPAVVQWIVRHGAQDAWICVGDGEPLHRWVGDETEYAVCEPRVWMPIPEWAGKS